MAPGFLFIQQAMAQPVLPRFSIPAFLSLLLCLLAGTAIFYQLARQWTHRRPRAAIEEWAAARRFAMRWSPRAQVPAALQRLAREQGAVAEATLTRGPLVLARLTAPAGEAPRRWHVLIRQANSDWTPAGLRPTGLGAAIYRQSLAEAFSLEPFASLLLSDRFVVHAAESRAARAMANAPARGLLPPDVGLLLYGQYVMLDFSSRPFDYVEFDRMLAVMEQLKDHLPTR